MGLRRYLELLRLPGVAPLFLATFVARLEYGVFALALILLLRAQGFGYAAIGVVSAATGLSVAVSAPVVGRVIDRVGQTRVLLGTAALGGVSGVALVVAAISGGGTLLLVVLAIAGGLTVPPVSASLRTLLPDLVGRERLDTAFAFDALQLEGIFISGPLLAAAIATVFSPEAAVLTAVGLQTVGALGLAATSTSRRWRPAAREPGSVRAGALSSPGLRTLIVVLTIVAVAVGVLEIGIPAFAERHGTRSNAGWLFALWAGGSLVGGLWYGARQWRSSTPRRFLFVSGVLALGLAPLPLAGSLPAFGALVAFAGLGLAPSTAACYSLVGELAPEGALTEAYAWQIVAYVTGAALGAWLGGVLVEAAGVATALACAPVAAALGLGVAVAGRSSLAPSANGNGAG